MFVSEVYCGRDVRIEKGASKDGGETRLRAKQREAARRLGKDAVGADQQTQASDACLKDLRLGFRDVV